MPEPNAADLVSAIGSILTVPAVFYGAWVAHQGLNTWRKQLRGTYEFDLARRLLRAVLEVGDELESFRGTMLSNAEMFEAMKCAGIDMASVNVMKDPRAEPLAYRRRWRRVLKARSRLHVAVVEAEVIWGNDAKAIELDLEKPLRLVYAAMEMFADRNDRATESKETRDLYHKLRGHLNSGAKPDEIADQVAAATKRFEDFVSPHLRRD